MRKAHRATRAAGRARRRPSPRRGKAEVGGLRPGCDLHVSLSQDHPDVVWVTQLWVSRDAHRASLGLPHARLDEIQALSDHRKALTELQRASGRLLQERRVVVAEDVRVPGALGGSK